MLPIKVPAPKVRPPADKSAASPPSAPVTIPPRTLLVLMSARALTSNAPPMMFPPAGAAHPHVKQGRLRPLAVTSAEPTQLAPGLPTVAASGVPGYQSVAVLAVFVPAKTPAAIVNRLNQMIRQVLSDPVVKERLFDSGVDTVGSSPAELAAFVKADMIRSGKLIKDIGIRGD